MLCSSVFCLAYLSKRKKKKKKKKITGVVLIANDVLGVMSQRWLVWGQFAY